MYGESFDTIRFDLGARDQGQTVNFMCTGGGHLGNMQIRYVPPPGIIGNSSLYMFY